MRVLLDTHVLLWWASGGGASLSTTARELIADPSTEALVSAASAYEIAIKSGAGRLDLPDDSTSYVEDLVRRHRFGPIAIDLRHALQAGALPRIHRDPFDRILVAQAQIERVPIVTADPVISRYDVETIW
ncbi:MAG: type II toxin-antitoxin system VapC family toxin [Candidatus Limnocylindrales bacterium]|nr:type II toxin-antitoxin system VapC family toxin [Chloroflexota bacterium]